MSSLKKTVKRKLQPLAARFAHRGDLTKTQPVYEDSVVEQGSLIVVDKTLLRVPVNQVLPDSLFFEDGKLMGRYGPSTTK